MNHVAIVLKNREYSGNLIAVLLVLILSMLILTLWSSSDGARRVHLEENSSLLPALKENFGGRKEDMDKITKLLKFEEQLRIVTLLGLPGVGKSTTAIFLAHQERKKGTVVMYLNLNDMGNLNGIKKKIVREAFRKQPTVEEVNDEFDDWMEQRSKPLLLIFDNYDQFANLYSESDLNFKNFVENELNVYLTKATVVVTSREELPLDPSLDIRTHTLAPLSDDSSIEVLVNHPTLMFVPLREQLRPLASMIGAISVVIKMISFQDWR